MILYSIMIVLFRGFFDSPGKEAISLSKAKREKKLSATQNNLFDKTLKKLEK
jgi:hypothetical protein